MEFSEDSSEAGSFYYEQDDSSSDFISGEGENNVNKQYRIITSAALGELQGDAINRATIALACSNSEASVALRYFRWDFDRLMASAATYQCTAEAIAERGKETVFASVGAATLKKAEPGTSCLACLDDLKGRDDVVTMDCGHAGCEECWIQHIRVQIDAGRACQLPCMGFKCNVVCSHQAVTRLLSKSNKELLKKYDHALLTSYINDNAHVRWCPSVPCCNRAIECLDDTYCEVKCDCGHSCCFKCGSEPHSPSTCSMWQQWELKLSDDSETKNYLKLRHLFADNAQDQLIDILTLGTSQGIREMLSVQAHSKPCPKCSIPVEKDGGCNLVVCTSCRQPFCWLCGAKTGTNHTWVHIDGHTCGTWKAAQDQEAQDSKAKHERYMHYYTHFRFNRCTSLLTRKLLESLQGHLDSMNKETVSEKLETLLPNLKAHVSGLVDWSYLETANCTLLECRRVLSNAYVFAYFMFDADNWLETMTRQENQRLQLLFEDSMSTLTSAVESLSQTLTNEIDVLTQSTIEASEDDTSTSSKSQSPKRAKVDNEATAKAGTDDSRLSVINIANAISKRIYNLFSLIDKDILSTIHSQNMQIAPYRPMCTPRR